MREIRIEGEEKIIIELEEPPKFFKFEPNKTYEVLIDLQRFPVIRKFKNKKGEEYPALVYNIKIVKENGREANSEWMQRRTDVGDYREENGERRVKPRMFSEFWQLAQIYDEFGAGIHKCIVKTRKGNRGQVLTRIIHSKDCPCLKSKSKEKSEVEEIENIQIYHPQEIAEKLKEIKEERAISIQEVVQRYNVDEETARKALEILEKEGLAVKIREDKYYISPK